MARNQHTPEELEKIATEISEVSDRLRGIANSMRQAKVESVLIHSATHLNFHIPEIIRWAEKSEVDARSQIRAILAETEPKVVAKKRYNDKQKLAAAKKAAKKKTT